MSDQTTPPEDDDLDVDPLAPLDDIPGEQDDLDTGTDLNDYDRTLLSEEELAALEGEEEDDDAAPADPVATETPAPAPAQAGETPAQQPAPVATLTDEAIDAAEAGMEAAKAAQKKVMEDYDDGELTAAERDEKMAELNDQIAEHGGVLRQAQEAFNAAKASFADTAKAYLAANPFLMEEEHLTAFDKMVREVSVSPLSTGKTHEQILAAAHRRYRADAAAFGTDLPEPVLSQPTAQPAVPKPKTTLAPKAAPPRTLQAIPPAAITGTSDGKYSSVQQQIDASTDPYEIERLMARMTQEEREAFASMDV